MIKNSFSFQHVEDFSLGCLVRLDAEGEYSEENSSLVSKIQFYAVEVARNREGKISRKPDFDNKHPNRVRRRISTDG